MTGLWPHVICVKIMKVLSILKEHTHHRTFRKCPDIVAGRCHGRQPAELKLTFLMIVKSGLNGCKPRPAFEPAQPLAVEIEYMPVQAPPTFKSFRHQAQYPDPAQIIPRRELNFADAQSKDPDNTQQEMKRIQAP